MFRFLCIIAVSLLFNSFAFMPAHAAPAAKHQKMINTAHLLQHWVHSYEEETPGKTIQIFRPKNSRTFGPSHFRMRYEFAKDGSCKWLFLAPNDAHHLKSGQWRLEPATSATPATLHITKDGDTVSYTIIELSKKILRLAPLDQGSN